jgi:uracil-DNA glycosylase family 4
VSKSLQPALSDLLTYLSEIGYGDLYLKPRTARPVEAVQAAPAAEPIASDTGMEEPAPILVFGSGNPQAELMLVGEGPAEDLDARGAAGELLTRILQAIELRREDVYVASIVKCAEPGELAACRGQLEQEIARVQPRVLVALGEAAAEALLEGSGKASPVSRMRGQWAQVRGIPTMITYHPAALLRNPGLKRPTWEDMQQVRDRLRAGAD